MKSRFVMLTMGVFAWAAIGQGVAQGYRAPGGPNQSQSNTAESAPAPDSKVPVQAAEADRSPLSFRIGGAEFSPLGFVDFTTVYRSTNVGSGIGTSFGSIPFNGASPAGQLSETRFSAQNSRIGLDVEANPTADLKFRGYFEADFLGSAPKNLEVTSHSNTARMRLGWVDVRWGKWEVLGGQSWSLMTPGRKSISPLPSDIFYSQNMDTNYQVGLVWLRTPGVRALFRPNDHWTMGVALEDPQQYTGGFVKLPAAFNPSQVDDSGGNSAAPNAAPDVIAKVAFDRNLGERQFHIEAAGLYRIFRLNTPTTHANVTRSGVGGSINLNLEIIKNLRWITTSFWSDGGGRYIFGLGPDFVVKVAESGNFVPTPLHSGSGIAGLEYQVAPKTLLYGYYGGAYFARNFQRIPSGSSSTLIGYGYPNSSSAQNRSIQEATIGVVQTLWKKRGYGDLKIITQASYLSRNPWSNATAPGGAKSAHLGMGYIDLRYDLP